MLPYVNRKRTPGQVKWVQRLIQAILTRIRAG
jgi:hypothetical protein